MKRGKRVLIKGQGEAGKPTLKVISPAQESVEIAKGQVKAIKDATKEGHAQSHSVSKTKTTCSRTKKSWKRTPKKSK